MSLSATVQCTCLREGRTAPPPFPPELLVIDEDGFFALDLPGGGDDRQWREMRAWLDTCCEHRRMALVDVAVSNWSGVSAFRDALKHAGPRDFPALLEDVFKRRTTEPDVASRALAELAAFRKLGRLGRHWCLLDTDTGHLVADTLSTRDDGRFLLGGGSGADVGLDADGMFVLSRTEPFAELFRATRLEQRVGTTQERLLEPGPTRPVPLADRDPVEFVNLDSGERYVGTVAVGGHHAPWPDGRRRNDAGQERLVFPRRLHVEERALTPASFEDVTEPLDELLRAAVATGNPVRWFS